MLFQKALKNGWSREKVIKEIRKIGVSCDFGTCPEVYLEKAFEGTEMRPDLPRKVAKELGETSIMFLVHPTLTDCEITLTCSVLEDVMRLATCS